MFSVQLIVRALGKSNLNRVPYTLNISGFGWNKKRRLIPIDTVLHQIVWKSYFKKFWTADWGRHDIKNKALFQEPLPSIIGLWIGGQLLPAVLKPENPKID